MWTKFKDWLKRNDKENKKQYKVCFYNIGFMGNKYKCGEYIEHNSGDDLELIGKEVFNKNIDTISKHYKDINGMINYTYTVELIKESNDEKY